MTFRSRPEAKPTRRRARRDDTRRSIYITITFSAAIAASLALMGGVFVAGYYNDHFAPVGAVNGAVISKNDVRAQADLQAAIFQRQIANLTTLRNQGKISSGEYSSMSSTASSGLTPSSPATVESNALTQLQNETILRQYAAKNNITVTDAQVNDQIQTDATIPDTRHVMIIGVQPARTGTGSTLTPSDDAAAQTRAQALLAEVKGGKKWADVANESAQDAITNGGPTGDLGMVTRDNAGLDLDMTDAVFSLVNINDTTAVIKGSDGIYRFATATAIVPKTVDAGWEAAIGQGDAYRAFARDEALNKAVRDKIEAQYISGATVQRHVLEIVVNKDASTPGDGDEVKFRMLVFSPNHSETGATNVPTTDAAWTEAKGRADAAMTALKADPSKWASLVSDTTQNDDQFVASRAGEVPWLTTPWFSAQTSSGSTGLGMTSVGAALYKQGLAAGTLLDPIQEPSAGWVIVQFEGRRPAPAQRIADAQLALNSGVDFATEATLISDTADSAKGGDKGWVSKYQLDSDQESAIWQVPVGGTTRVIAGNVYVIYKVLEEQTRVQDANTQAEMKASVYPRWLSELEGSALVWTDTAGVAAMAPASPTP